MKSFSTTLGILVFTAASVIAGPIIVTPTANGTALAAALGGAGLTITSVTVTSGAATQFGTYTGFTGAAVTLGDGIVLSTGLAAQTTASFHSAGNSPSTNTGASGTSEFNAYGPGRITNFSSSNDVAAILVTFSLLAPSQVGFDFAFGTAEYPVFTSNYTDAFLAFLDGTAVSNQIVFDASNNPVQVGSSFAGALTTADTNTAFSSPHGLLKLQTFTLSQLSAGTHTLLFEVGDVNDHVLDSAAFISNLRAGTGTGGTTVSDGSAVPEPSTFGLAGLALVAIAAFRRRRA